MTTTTTTTKTRPRTFRPSLAPSRQSLFVLSWLHHAQDFLIYIDQSHPSK